jgi:hypothetical protein
MTDSNIVVNFSPTAVEDKKSLLLETKEFVSKHLVIRNQDELDEANALLRDIKSESKAIEEMKESVLKPISLGMATFRSFFAPVEKLCDELESSVKERISAFVIEARKKAEEDSQKLLAAADSSDYNTLTTLVQEAQVAPTLKGTSVREVWVATVAYPSAVPRDWCVPDDKRIAAHARNTPIEQAPTPIAGVTFMKKSVVSARS